MDLDSRVCEVHGHAKGGRPTAPPAALATTRCWPAGPTPASWCTCGCAPARPTPPAEPSGSSRAGRSGPPGRASGPLTLRGDSGCWSAKVTGGCRRHGIGCSITVRQTKPVKAAIAAISRDAWTDIDDPDGGPPRWPRRPLLARRVAG